MDEEVEKIVADAKKQESGFAYTDQWQILTAIAERLQDLGHEALKLEYMIDDVEGGEE
uniref:hypothetical protein n=1 Tax=Prevotella sp. TaxID=59823 RepID=UPI0040297C81